MKKDEVAADWLTVLIAAACFWYVLAPALSTDLVLFKRDHSVAFRGLLHEVIEAVRAGHFPAWNPFRGGGEPLAAYPSAMVWSPMLAVFAGPGEFDALYDAYVVLHFVLGGLGVAYLAAQLRLTSSACTLAGLAYGLSGPLLSLNNLLPSLHTAVFGPWALAFCLRWLRRRDPRSFALASAGIATHAALTDPAYLICSALLFLAILGSRALDHEGAGLLKEALRTSAAGVFAVMLVALPVLLTIDLLRDTPRGRGFAYSLLSHFSLNPVRTAELFLPRLAGSSTVSWLADQYRITGPRLYLDSLYLGASGLPLLFGGILTRRARIWISLAALFWLLMLGHNTPLHGWLVGVVPGLQMSRFPVKFSYGLAVCTSIVLAIGFDATLRGELSAQRQKLAALGGALVLGATLFLVRTFGLSKISPTTSAVTEEVAASLVDRAASHAVLFGLLASLLLFLATRTRSRWIAPAFLLLIGADLALQGRWVLPTAPRSLYDAPALAGVVRADAEHPVVYLFHEHQLPPLIEGPVEVDHVRYGVERLDPGVSMSLGIQHVFDMDLSSNRSAEWTALHDALSTTSEAGRFALLGRVGVRHLLNAASEDPPPGLLLVGQSPTTGGYPIGAFRLGAHRSFVEWVPAVQRAGSISEIRDSLTSTSSDLDVAVLDTRLPSAGSVELPDSSALRRRSVSPSKVRSGKIALELESEARGLLVVAQNYDPGWRATVNGAPAPVVRVEGIRLGVPLDSGRSSVTLEYVPRTFSAGAICSGIAWAVWLALLGLSFLRRTRNLPPNPDQ